MSPDDVAAIVAQPWWARLGYRADPTHDPQSARRDLLIAFTDTCQPGTFRGPRFPTHNENATFRVKSSVLPVAWPYDR